MSYCHECGFDLRGAPTVEPVYYDNQASGLLLEASHMLDPDYHPVNAQWDLGRYDVMHQLCRITTARYKHVSLRKFVLDQAGLLDVPLTEGHISFEMRPIEERHHLAQLGAWLLVDMEPRLTAAWRAHSVRYSVLLKDFTERPNWYNQIVRRLANWRNRISN